MEGGSSFSKEDVTMSPRFSCTVDFWAMHEF